MSLVVGLVGLVFVLNFLSWLIAALMLGAGWRRPQACVWRRKL
jgi:hypothetical protein